MVAALLWILVAVLSVVLWRRDGTGALIVTVRQALWRAVGMLPRLAAALLTAGFTAKLLTFVPIARYIGPEAGFRGVLIAMVVGSVMPAGPVVAFPTVVVLSHAGAGTVQIVTFLTAWSVFALHRVLTYEIPMMGPRFTAMRFVASLPLPFIAAALTELFLVALG